MKNVIVCFCLLLISQFIHAQTVEVQGQLKVTTVPQNNAGTDVLVRNTDGTVAKRDVNTIGGVPITGIILSEVEDNTTLTNAGFSKTGISEIVYRVQNDATKYRKWVGPTSLINAPIESQYPTSIRTGTEMIIWGGYGNEGVKTGGKYDPLADTWTGVSTANEPSSRNSHVGIWTTNEMIIWGGNANKHWGQI